MYYSFDDWRLDHFRGSKHHLKKYDAILQHKRTGKQAVVPFGQKGYDQYHDQALGLYENFDHFDKKRRKLYRNRHKKWLKEGYYSPAWCSWNYLW